MINSRSSSLVELIEMSLLANHEILVLLSRNSGFSSQAGEKEVGRILKSIGYMNEPWFKVEWSIRRTTNNYPLEDLIIISSTDFNNENLSKIYLRDMD
jgi:hypothetical protein